MFYLDFNDLQNYKICADSTKYGLDFIKKRLRRNFIVRYPIPHESLRSSWGFLSRNLFEVLMFDEKDVTELRDTSKMLFIRNPTM